MKKILLIIISIGVYSSAIAQTSWGTTIGKTYYDLQSNSSVGNRIVKNSDGSMSAVWTEHWDFLTQINEPTGIRGFGYNYFDPTTASWAYGADGECWQDDNGCASSYMGWPEIINTPSALGNKEMVISHFNGQSIVGLSETIRSSIGTGNWSNTTTLGIDTLYDLATSSNNFGGIFPRAVSSNNNVHLITSFNGASYATPVIDANGVRNTFRYYRSSNAGQTWDITNMILPFDSTDIKRIDSDGYAIHANGNTVAITCGAGIDNDWIMLKSTDNGNTWTKTTVLDNHNLDTSFVGNNNSKGVITNDDSFDLVIDDNGVVHCFATMGITDDGGFIYADHDLYYTSGAGILYWKEGMLEVDTIAFPDYGYDGNPNDYGIDGAERYGNFFQSYPTASFDASGNIYLLYSAIVEGTQFINTTSNDTVGYNDIYMVYSLDNGATWCKTNDPINVAEDVYGQLGGTPTQDEVFPCAVPKVVNGFLDFTFQSDYNRPGLALVDDTHPNDHLNYIIHSRMDVNGLTSCTSVPVVATCRAIDSASYDLCVGDSIFLFGQYYTTSFLRADTITNSICDTILVTSVNFHNIAGDTNCNGAIDSLEIAGDVNGNGVIDGNEIAGDLDGNGVIDNGELEGDVNGNGVIDGGELLGDTNGNGVIDPSEEVRSIEEGSFGEIKIMPNPYYNTAVVSFNNSNLPVEIRLYNIVGVVQQTYKTTSNSIEINREGLVNGIYFLELENDKKTTMIKVIIQ